MQKFAQHDGYSAHLLNSRVLEHLYVRTTKKFFYQCVVHRVCVTLGSQRWWSWAKKARALQIELRRHTVRPNSTNPLIISKLEVTFSWVFPNKLQKDLHNFRFRNVCTSSTVVGISTLRFQINKYTWLYDFPIFLPTNLHFFPLLTLQIWEIYPAYWFLGIPPRYILHTFFYQFCQNLLPYILIRLGLLILRNFPNMSTHLFGPSCVFGTWE